ncbi:MAG: hypothetical protein ACKPKO_46210, partial [Candidatus Fonsibacter sp.]
MTSHDLDALIAERLGHVLFPLSLERDVELHDNYNLRLEYKAAGARYDGAARRWSMRAGSDLRPVLFLHRTWVDDPELLYRECLFVALRRANAVE